MGKIQQKVDAWSETAANKYVNSKVNNTISKVSSGTQDVYNVASNAVVLSLSKAWIGIGTLNPSKTQSEDKMFAAPKLPQFKKESWNEIDVNNIVANGVFDRFDYSKLWHLQLGDYYMPLSQTFTLRAKKRINVSALVDGIEIIQQTRKEAKTIECTLRIGIDGKKQPNLQIVDDLGFMGELSDVLSELYETNAVFRINNAMINNTFKVTHVIMTEYKFIPRVGMGTYGFEFALTEVNYGKNVLTLDLSKIDDENKYRQLVG